ncbi:hypothetical protein D9M72_411380 [compost metagenome]
MPAPGRLSPGTTAPRLLTEALFSMRMSRPAVISSVPGPATLKVLNRMSRPAETTEMSPGFWCANRLPLLAK